MSDEEILRKERKPHVTIDEISELLLQYWNIHAEKDLCKQLDSYDDCNIYIQTKDKREYIVKVYNGAENENTIEGFANMFEWIQNKHLSYDFPSVQPSIHHLSVEYIIPSIRHSHCKEEYKNGIRLFKWIHGNTLNNIPITYNTYYNVGIMLGTLTIAMQDFNHPSFNRIHAWDLKQFDSILPFISSVQEQDIRDIITSVHDEFISILLPDSTQFRWSVIQGDCNDANIIVRETSHDSNQYDVVGLIDFGDSVYSWTVNDVATCICYALLSSFGRDNPHDVIHAVFTSYSSVYPLNNAEKLHLRTLICMRLSLSTAIGAYSISLSPHDEYLKLHAIPAKNALRFVWALNKDYFLKDLPLINQ